MSEPTRAQRLGLEPGSIISGWSPDASAAEREVAHSIAISLKRIADMSDRIALALERFDSTMANWSTRNRP